MLSPRRRVDLPRVLLALLLFPLVARAGINQWTTNGPSGGVLALAMDPGPAGTLYAANGDGIYRSSDLAQSWTLISPVARTVEPVDLLKVDPLDPMTLYVLADLFRPNLFRSKML